MEFLKALREAERMGISKSDFIPIWEKEMDQHCGSSSKPRNLDTKDSKTETGVYKHIEYLATEISSLKLEAQNLRQEVMTLRTDLLNQSTEVIKETINQCLAQYFSDFIKKLSESGKHSVQEEKISTPSAVKSGDSISSDSDTNLTTGEFIIDFDELEESSFHSKILSPSYELDINPSCTAKLACWVNDENRLHVSVALWASNHVPLTSDTYFKITGRIKNKNSERFSELFTGETKKLNKLQAFKKEWFEITVCLETAKFSYSEVTLDDLNQKGFVINDTLVIAWEIEEQ